MTPDQFFDRATDELLEAFENVDSGFDNLVISVFTCPSVQKVTSVDRDLAIAKLRGVLTKVDSRDGVLQGSLFSRSYELAEELGYQTVTPNLLLKSIAHCESDGDLEPLIQCLTSLGLSPLVLRKQVESESFIYGDLGYGLDLNRKMASVESSPLIGRGDELGRLQKILLAERSAVLTGKPGVGKSALAEGLSWYIVHRPARIIEELRNIRIVSIQASDLIAGSSRQGELEERVKTFIGHILATPDLIVFIDEIHSLFSGSEKTGKTIVDNLKPVLARGSVQVVGASTDSEYQQYFQADRALRERFRRISLKEPSVKETISIIEGIGDELLSDRVRNRGAALSSEGISEAVKLSTVHYPASSRPRKPIDLLKEAASEKAYQLAKGDAVKGAIGADEVRSIVADELSINPSLLSDDSFTQMSYLMDQINSAYPTQPKIGEDVAHALSLALAGLADSQLPIATLGFVGDVNQADSLLAVIARTICGTEDAVYRIDVASLDSDSAVFQLRGAPQGYRDSGVGSNVFNEVGVDGRPHVIVFENIGDGAGKAIRPDVAAIVLSMLSGTARSARNEETNFSKCVFVFSSRRNEEQTANFLGKRITGLIDKFLHFDAKQESASLHELQGLIADRIHAGNVPEELQLLLQDSEKQQVLLDNANVRGLRRALNDFMKSALVRLACDAQSLNN